MGNLARNNSPKSFLRRFIFLKKFLYKIKFLLTIFAVLI